MHKRPPGGLPIRRRISPDGVAFRKTDTIDKFPSRHWVLMAEWAVIDRTLA